jgi:PAS domain S-box-containing protein
MKNKGNSSSTLTENEFSDLNNSFENSFSLLIVTDIDCQKITFLSQTAINFLGEDKAEFLCGDRDFFKDIIHPKDYPLYMEHLLSFKDKLSINQKSKEIVIRLRVKDGTWSQYCFKDRIYNWSLNGVKNLIITNAVPVTDLKEDASLCDAAFKPLIPESKYDHLLNSIDDAYCIIEMIYNNKGEPADYQFIETNLAFEKQAKLKDFSGKTIREIIPNLEKHWFDRYGKIAVTGESLRFEEYNEKLFKEWYDVYAFKIGGYHSRKVAILFQNITQRKLAEQNLIKGEAELRERVKLRQQEFDDNAQLLQAVFDNTNLAIAVLKTVYDEKGFIHDLEFIQVNKVLRELYLEKEVIGNTYKEISKYGIKMGIFDAYKRVMETGEIMDQEYFIDREGNQQWFRVMARKLNDLLITSMEDITERKDESQKLKEAMRFNKQLVQTSPNTIIIINLNDFKVRYINQDMLSRVGMTRDKILGMALPNILHYLHPRDREKLLNFHKKILKSSEEEIHEIEFRVKIKGSEWEWFNARGKIFNRKNESWVDEYVLVVRNISEEKNTQRALINAEKLSIQGEVARTLAHELRNPLASIRMATDVLSHKLPMEQKEQLENYFNILSRSTKILNNLVSNLLNSSNYSPAVLEKIDLVECVDLAIEQAADRIYLTGIKVLKKFTGPYYILADMEKLNIALLNIIVNASEATNPNEGIIEISISNHKTDYMLSITDNGHGLEQEEIDRLFDAFYTNKASGAGIGLTSVKNILEEHDAQIKVSSKPGIGTTFKIFFNNLEMA